MRHPVLSILCPSDVKSCQSPSTSEDTDRNRPLHWNGETLFLFNSSGHPWRSSGSDLFHLDPAYQRTEYNNKTNGGRWIECDVSFNPDLANPLGWKLSAYCGGHFRDLQRLLRELIVRIQTQSQTLPVTRDVVDRAINEVRAQYLPIAVEDAQWLAEIGKHRSTVLQSVAPDQVSRLSRFLDTHFVLYFSNAEDWYDIHPSIREEVARLARTARTTSAKAKSAQT